ncbi:hypothetical protein [Flammeovirga sp. SubArs3]|uniref:hypothetical protein n=1 Tax=Flammeovirga sp. SubArs3 TaxID=2995316 RepID=UPI00248B6BEA|nr:hypothetical protein [Flammeovirga sp. SubArs3]
MNFKSLKESELLSFTERMFSNIPEVEGLQQRLTTVGYDEKKIKQGLALQKKAKEDVDNNYLQLVESQKTRIKRDEAYMVFKDKVSKIRKGLKVLFKKDAILIADLGLNQRFPRPKTDQIDSVKKLIQKLQANKAIHAKLLALRLDEENLKLFSKEIKELEKLLSQNTLDKGLDQTLTEKKNKSISELIEWCDEFMVAARFATDDDEQIIESLGVIV